MLGLAVDAMFSGGETRKHGSAYQRAFKWAICVALATHQVKALPFQGNAGLPDSTVLTSRNMLLRVQVSVEIQLMPPIKGTAESLIGNLPLNEIDESKSYIVTLDDLDDSDNGGGSEEESTQLVDSSLQVEQHLVFPWELFYKVDGELCVRGNTTLSLLLPIQTTNKRNPVLTARTIVVTLWEDNVMTSMSSLMPPKLLARRLANLPRMSVSANNRGSSNAVSTEQRTAGPFMIIQLHGTTTFELKFDGSATDSEDLRHRQSFAIILVFGVAVMVAVFNQHRLAAKIEGRPATRGRVDYSNNPDRVGARNLPRESSPQKVAPADQKCNDENDTTSTSAMDKNQASRIKDESHGAILSGTTQIARWNVPIPQFRNFEPWESTGKGRMNKEDTTTGQGHWTDPQQVYPTQLFLPAAAAPTTQRLPEEVELESHSREIRTLDTFRVRVTPSPPQSYKSSLTVKAPVPINLSSKEAKEAKMGPANPLKKDHEPAMRATQSGSDRPLRNVVPLTATSQMDSMLLAEGNGARTRTQEGKKASDLCNLADEGGMDYRDGSKSYNNRNKPYMKTCLFDQSDNALMRGLGTTNEGLSLPGREDHQEMRRLDSISSHSSSRPRSNAFNRGASREGNWLQELRNRAQGHERRYSTTTSNDVIEASRANKTKSAPPFKTPKDVKAYDHRVISLDDSSHASSTEHHHKRLETRSKHGSRKRRVSASPTLESTGGARDKQRGRRRSSSSRSATTSTRKRHSSVLRDEKENLGSHSSEGRITMPKPKKYKRRRLAKADDLLLPDVTASASLASAAQSVHAPLWELGGPTPPPKSKRRARGASSAASNR